MADALAPQLFPSVAAPVRPQRAMPRPRPRGPVLMGDLHASLGGRPLLLLHWDEAKDEGVDG